MVIDRDVLVSTLDRVADSYVAINRMPPQKGVRVLGHKNRFPESANEAGGDRYD